MSELIRAWLIQPIIDLLEILTKEIKMDQIELIGKLNQVFETLGVVSDESKALLAEVAALKDALKIAGQTTAEVDAALAAVVARTTAIDALVPNV